MTPDDIQDLLRQRDELLANDELPAQPSIEAIESEEIRELGKIVLETTNEDLVVFSTT